MTPRLNTFEAAPRAMGAWLTYSQKAAADGLEQSLVHLVKIRASQLNGCANCLNMHTQEARKDGETERRSTAHASGRRWPGPTP
jgi:AhpD family alkylhydroperoxidase